MAVIAGAGQALGGDGPLLHPGAGLQHVEEAEPDRLLDLRIAVDDHVGAIPEGVQKLPLLPDQPVPPGEAGAGQGGRGLVAQGGQGRRLDQP